MAWTEQDIDLNGVKLHYYRRGRGRPLVLAHGATDNALCWTRVAEALESEYDIVAYDARYHGLSAAPEAPEPEAGSDLIALVERLGLQRPAIMGHSMGAGSVAAAAARKPELFRCAVLEDPGWRNADPPGGRPAPTDYSSMSSAEIEAQGRERSPMWDDAEFPAWVQSKLQYRRPAGAARLAPPGAWRETAQRLRLPVLLITGGNTERGAIVTPEVAEEARRLCPTLEVVRFEQAGHNIRREAFGEFVQAVRAFLAAH